MFNYLLLLIVLLAISGCSTEDSLKEYYFSLDDFKEGLVYEFSVPESDENPLYWKMQSYPEEDLFITDYYDSDYNQLEHMEEIFEDNYAVVQSFSKMNSLETIECTILENKIYPWQMSQDSQYKINYIQQGTEVTMIKNRRFDKFEELTIMGQKYECAKFMEEYIFKSEIPENNYQFTQESYYAKGLGLVKSTRIFSAFNNMTLELKKIHTLEEWNQMISSK